MHGAGGEWRVERPRISWEILDAVRDAAAEVGIPKIADFNRGDNEGSDYFEVNQRRGLRVSAAKAFLKPVLKRKNLRLVTGAHARRLIVEDGRVAGLEYSRGGQPHVSARATRDRADRRRDRHAASAGALRHRPARSARRGSAHPCCTRCPASARTCRTICNCARSSRSAARARSTSISSRWYKRALMGLDYAFNRRGPLTMAPSQLGMFAKSSPDYETANVEFHVQPLSLDRFGDPLHKFPAITLSVCNLRPASRGYVHAASADPTPRRSSSRTISARKRTAASPPTRSAWREKSPPRRRSRASSRENICPAPR